MSETSKDKGETASVDSTENIDKPKCTAEEKDETKEASGGHEGGKKERDKEENNGEDDDDDDEKGEMDQLSKFFLSKLSVGGKKETPPQVLDDLTIDGLVQYIQSGKCKNIITMAGAGISTSAGIPDFRSPSSGLYSNLQKYDLPYPEAIFEIKFFKSNPKPFFVLAKELYPGSFNPTPSHLFLRLLHEKGLLLRHYTQNIDTLEHVAKLPAEKLVEAHGSFRIAHCLECRKEYSQEWVKDEIFADRIPNCPSCSGLVKPDIIFFGESLPTRFFQLIQSDFPKCDLLIIMGTSLNVQPFASLINNVPGNCPRLLINREKAGVADHMMSGLMLDNPRNTRDLALIGDCDVGATDLAKKCGWEDDFKKLQDEYKEPHSEDGTTYTHCCCLL